MDYQTILLIVLAIMTLTLAFLLNSRIRKEKNQATVPDQINIAEFSDLVKSNSLDGSIQKIARKVSDLLKGSFECDRIIFMRKQRSHLELNYYHGIRGFRRDEFRIRYNKKLSDLLRQDPMLRSISELADDIPESVMKRLSHHGFEQFFAIYWRENLYGLYFIRSISATDQITFKMLILSTAQSLAAAYHIKWHESRYERKHSEPTTTFSQKVDVKPTDGILKLISHRRTDSLIPSIGSMLQEELSLGQLALLYEAPARKDPVSVWQHGLEDAVSSPDGLSFTSLIDKLNRSDQVKFGDLTNNSHLKDSELAETLRAAGLQYLVSYPISAKRNGIVAWTGSADPASISSRLESLSTHTRGLVENAEEYERMEEMSNSDNLTGLANQRYFSKRLAEEINRCHRYDRRLSLIILDMDELKAVNDRYGHMAGDEVLRRMGQILKGSIRAIDVIARYGGDEFCVIMPETSREMCENFMKRLRLKISSSKFSINNGETTLRCTISQGGAVFPESGREPNELLKAADSALLLAKESGRDCYMICDSSITSNLS